MVEVVVLVLLVMLVKVAMEILEILAPMDKQDKQLLLEVIIFLVALVVKKEMEILEIQAILEAQVTVVLEAAVAVEVPVVGHSTIVRVKTTISILVWQEAAEAAVAIEVKKAIQAAAVAPRVAEAAVDKPALVMMV